MWISDDTFRIIKLSIEDDRVDKSMVTDYDDFVLPIQIVSFQISNEIKAQKPLNILIDILRLFEWSQVFVYLPAVMREYDDYRAIPWIRDRYE